MSEQQENVIYVGTKPAVKYAAAVAAEFENGASEVFLKARGRAISRAVDAAEITVNRFLEGVEVKDIKISTEELENRNVSSIEILLSKV
ncbi:MAG: DNA-binding protein Alba [Thermoplasmata archaeon]|nr:MAG: DNA-binding protein Alba [Thermoplasmata archaeon]MCD6171185.1 DNA-binding protein Alba [Thermoplasmata archaeon]